MLVKAVAGSSRGNKVIVKKNRRLSIRIVIRSAFEIVFESLVGVLTLSTGEYRILLRFVNYRRNQPLKINDPFASTHWEGRFAKKRDGISK